MHTFTAPAPEDLKEIALQVRKLFPELKIYLLEGDLGAGKTTFVKAFCNISGVKEDVSSPTFSLVHEYQGEEKIYHFDLYRLKNVNDLYQIGFEEYLNENKAYKLIEWPELALELIDEPYLHLTFAIENKNQRTLSCRKVNNP